MKAKIGVLDSGVGGLSVLREIHRLLPTHPTLYFADQAHVPYGPRNPDEINEFVETITRFLLLQGARVIVVACHAASTASLYDLRVRFPDVPFVGMEPAIKPAVETSKNGVIGVLTTQATASGKLYRSVLERFAGDVRVITQVAPELVQIAENGQQNTGPGREMIAHYVNPLLDAGADKIVMACTHFPFLADEISTLAGAQAMIVDPGAAIARQVARMWPDDADIAPAENEYFTSGDPQQFRTLLRALLNVDTVVSGVEFSSMEHDDA